MMRRLALAAFIVVAPIANAQVPNAHSSPDSTDVVAQARWMSSSVSSFLLALFTGAHGESGLPQSRCGYACNRGGASRPPTLHYSGAGIAGLFGLVTGHSVRRSSIPRGSSAASGASTSPSVTSDPPAAPSPVSDADAAASSGHATPDQGSPTGNRSDGRPATPSPAAENVVIPSWQYATACAFGCVERSAEGASGGPASIESDGDAAVREEAVIDAAVPSGGPTVMALDVVSPADVIVNPEPETVILTLAGLGALFVVKARQARGE